MLLNRLCTALGVEFSSRMLSWVAGPKPFDGAWAPHWYGAVHRSTGFDGAEGPVPDLPPDYARISDAAMPYYTQLARYAL